MPSITDDRPPKANPRYVRFPEPVDREVAARAKAAGMSASELIVALVTLALAGAFAKSRDATHE